MELSAATPADEAFLLDLLNTTPVIDGQPTDALADFDTATAWLTQHGTVADRSEWTALLQARSLLQAVVRGDARAAALQPLLSQARLVPTASDDGLDWHLAGRGATGAVRAALAWDCLRIKNPGRLRPCANTECRLFLIDHSKPNTARWCSMAICGNRMKARRHYRRTHAEQET